MFKKTVLWVAGAITLVVNSPVRAAVVNPASTNRNEADEAVGRALRTLDTETVRKECGHVLGRSLAKECGYTVPGKGRL